MKVSDFGKWGESGSDRLAGKWLCQVGKSGSGWSVGMSYSSIQQDGWNTGVPVWDFLSHTHHCKRGWVGRDCERQSQ